MSKTPTVDDLFDELLRAQMAGIMRVYAASIFTATSQDQRVEIFDALVRHGAMAIAVAAASRPNPAVLAEIEERLPSMIRTAIELLRERLAPDVFIPNTNAAQETLQ